MKLPRRVEVLAVGDELLDGRVADTNTLRLAHKLHPLGIEVTQRTTVRDVLEDIVREARAIAARGTELCIVSGGLGPTADDLTSEAFARLAEVELVRDETSAKAIADRLKARGRAMTDNQLKQADRPKSAEVIPNKNGTAPGFALEYKGCRFLSLPGVPHEFDAMIDQAVVAPLTGVGAPLEKRIFKCFGLIEAEVDKRLVDLATLTPDVRVGFRVKFPEIHVTLTARDAGQLALAETHIREKLGEYVFAEDDRELAQVVLESLKARGDSLAIGESCTGGLISDLLTDIPGASEVFIGAAVTYAYATKTDLLAVSNETLTREGAVSEATVREMARGAQQRFGAKWALGVSGVAGPGGGTLGKPVGTIWLALAGPTGERSAKLQLLFDRRGNKLVAAYSALEMLRRELRTLAAG